MHSPFPLLCCSGQLGDKLSYINALVPGRCGSCFKSISFRLIIQNSRLAIFCEILLRWMTHHWWLVNIGSGNGLLTADTKPLPVPMLTYHQMHPETLTWLQFHLIHNMFSNIALLSYDTCYIWYSCNMYPLINTYPCKYDFIYLTTWIGSLLPSDNWNDKPS